MTPTTIAIIIGITVISAFIVLGLYMFDRATKRIETLILSSSKRTNITVSHHDHKLTQHKIKV